MPHSLDQICPEEHLSLDSPSDEAYRLRSERVRHRLMAGKSFVGCNGARGSGTGHLERRFNSESNLNRVEE